MSALLDEVYRLAGAKTDISLHLGFLLGLASRPEVKHIMEFGFRTGVSTTALLASGKPVVTIDPDPSCEPHVKRLKALGGNLAWIRTSSLLPMEFRCDLLHIDSLHTYKQLRAELFIHHEKVSRWIVMHDTETFATKGKDGTTPGLQAAIDEFLSENKQWRLYMNLPHNNGITLLERSTMPSAEATIGHQDYGVRKESSGS